MKKEKIHNVVSIFAAVLLIMLTAVVSVRYILPVALPFLIAWATAFAVRPAAGIISRKTRIPERILRVILALLGTLLLFLSVFFILRESVSALWRLLSEIGDGNALYDLISGLTDPSLPIFGDMMPKELVAEIGNAIRNMLTAALTALGTAVTSWVAAVPRAVLFIIVTVIATVYFSLDLEGINRTVRRILPSSVGERLSLLRRELFSVGLKYVGSYLVIMIITFSIMLTGLALMRVRGALLISVIIAMLDVLPVIGVGTVLVPWSIFAFATGNHAMGISLLLLLLVNEVVRQLVEPHIVGKNLGIHPLLTLVLIYVGYSFFGIYGLLFVPLVPAFIGLSERRLTERNKDRQDR